MPPACGFENEIFGSVSAGIGTFLANGNGSAETPTEGGGQHWHHPDFEVAYVDHRVSLKVTV